MKAEHVLKALAILAASIIFILWSINQVRADSIYIIKRSHHFNPSTSIKREFHPLFIYEREDGYFVGYWRNSYDRHTVAVGRRFLLGAYGDFEYGYKAGAFTGYRFPVGAALFLDYKSLSCDSLITVVACGFKWGF